MVTNRTVQFLSLRHGDCFSLIVHSMTEKIKLTSFIVPLNIYSICLLFSIPHYLFTIFHYPSLSFAIFPYLSLCFAIPHYLFTIFLYVSLSLTNSANFAIPHYLLTIFYLSLLISLIPLITLS